MLTQNAVSKIYLVALLFVLCGKFDAAAGGRPYFVLCGEPEKHRLCTEIFSLRAATDSYQAELLAAHAAVKRFKNPRVEVDPTKADKPSRFHRCPVADFIAAGLSIDPYAPDYSRSKR